MTNLYIHLLLQVQNHSASDSASISVIRSYVERLARDGGLDLWDWLAIVIAFISLVIAWLMAVWQKRTERNTMKITKEGQIGLLVDYIRHFYTNLVVIISVTEKLKGRFSSHYPSEEHFRKLIIDLEVLHPEAFFHSKEKYNQIHKLLLLLRNYNIEVDVAEKHLCSRSVEPYAKERDLNTLIFKPDLLCRSFLDCIRNLCEDVSKERYGFLSKYPFLAGCLDRISFIKANVSNQQLYSGYISQIRESIIAEAVKRTGNIEAFKRFENIPADGEPEKEILKQKAEILRVESQKIERRYWPEKSSFADMIFPDDKDLFFALLNHNVDTEMNGLNGQHYPKIFILSF